MLCYVYHFLIQHYISLRMIYNASHVEFTLLFYKIFKIFQWKDTTCTAVERCSCSNMHQNMETGDSFLFFKWDVWIILSTISFCFKNKYNFNAKISVNSFFWEYILFILKLFSKLYCNFYCYLIIQVYGKSVSLFV